MGLFKSRNDVYERNTKIAELESRVEMLEQEAQRLRTENSELLAELDRLRAANSAMRTESARVSRASLAFDAADGSDEDGSDDDEDGRGRLKKERGFVDGRLPLEKYALELKRLKQFSEKWQRYFADAELIEKQELSNLLTDLLRDGKSVDFVLSAKETADKIFKVVGEPFDPKAVIEDYFDSEETGFDLDEAVNPKGELDLESLCKELGVFEG